VFDGVAEDPSNAELELRAVRPAEREVGVEVDAGAEALDGERRLIPVEQVEDHFVERRPLRQ
jgi:hypothetical protein